MVEILVDYAVGNALGTLGSKTALEQTTYAPGSFNEAFLWKKIRVSGMVKWASLADRAFLVLAYNNDGVTGIRDGMGAGAGGVLAVDPETDHTQYAADQILARNVVDFMALPSGLGHGVNEAVAFNWEPHLPARGLPTRKEDCLSLFVWNPAGGAMTTGSIVETALRAWGAWMK